ncbi:hypothetical protein HDU93_005841, partial [Gonapodya sp. JEL0774]
MELQLERPREKKKAKPKVERRVVIEPAAQTVTSGVESADRGSEVGAPSGLENVQSFSKISAPIETLLDDSTGTVESVEVRLSELNYIVGDRTTKHDH